MRYFEDYAVGERAAFGRYVVDRDEAIAFARKYDPQPFHLSDEAAAKTHFGRLATSGWHSAAMAMAMLVENMQTGEETASLGAIGIDELRWLKPVHPGDVLRLETEVLELTPSRSKPMGIVRSRFTLFNQDDVPVMSWIPIAMVRTRAAGSTPAAA